MNNVKNIVIKPIIQQKKATIDDELFVSVILVYTDYTIRHLTTYIKRKYGFEDTNIMKYMVFDTLSRNSPIEITKADKTLISSAIDDFYKTGIPDYFKNRE